MGNYISNNSARRNALVLIANYMVNSVPKKWWDREDRINARYVCKEAFKRVAKCSDAPLCIVERMYDEYDVYEEKCGEASRYVYSIGTGVISDILSLMS